MDRKEFIFNMLGLAVMNPMSYAYADGFAHSSGREINDPLKLFLAGDVMTGRGIDQVLPYSVNPRLYERYTNSAERYVQLTEQTSGNIPDEVSYHYIWGDALEIINNIDPDTRIVNLETAVTTHDGYWKNKGIHYRMHPKNTPLLTEAGIGICVLGNNHALDWGYDGLEETLDVLQQAGIQTTGAGIDAESAAKPAVIELEKGRLLVFAYGSPSAGVPMTWSADDDQPGVNVLPNMSLQTAEQVASNIGRHRRKGDLVVLSLHWGGNWGYEIPQQQQKFARRLIDQGIVDVIFGHSSHHPKGIEVYDGKLILYGCGDLINDYEGIGGHEQFRTDLRLMYFPILDEDGTLQSLEMIPVRVDRFQLQRATEEDGEWLRKILDRECSQFGHSVEKSSEGNLALRWE